MTTRADEERAAPEVTVERSEGGGWTGIVDGRPVFTALLGRDDWWVEAEARGARNLERYARERALGCEAVLAAIRAEREAARAQRAATSDS